MKTVINGALALALMASTAGTALAQGAEDHDRWHNAGERSPQARPEQRQEAPRAQPQAAPQQQQQQQPRAQQGPGGWQRDANGHNWRGAPGGQPGGPRGGQAPVAQAPAPAAPPAAAPQNRGGRNDGGQRWNGDRNNGRPDGDRGRDDNRGRWDNNRDGRPDGRNDGRWDNRPGADNRWNGRNDNQWRGGNDNHWRGGDNRQDRPRYDPRNYPRQWHSPQRYRGFAYRPPPGFYVHSWGFGDILPRAWWGPDYRLNSWWDYGLPIPPIGYEWVRVGDDALLVDIYSGRVVQVAYDMFW